MTLVDLSISRKGLLLVSVPLLFELVFVASLLLMLQESDRRVVAQMQSKDMVATASDLNNKMLTASYMLFLWKISQSDDCLKRYQLCTEESQKLCSRLSSISHGNERREKDAKRIVQMSEDVISLSTRSLRSDETASFSLKGMDSYSIQCKRSFQALFDQVQLVIQEEQQIQVGGSESEQQAKSMAYTLIFCAIGVNVLLTILLAIYFSKSITRRLSTVMDNTELLAEHRPLNTLVDGHDEIARLDRVFHRMAEALEHSEKMKSEYVAMITHDLKAPLTSMHTAVSLLSSSVKHIDDEKQKRRFGVLERNVSGMIKLVTDLLDMDKIEGGALRLELESKAIAIIIIEAVESMRFFAEQYKVELQIAAPNNNAEVECDPHRIEQVLANLITNSVKFSQPGGKVQISYKQKRDFVEISVEDHGRGIPQEDIHRIFDRFKQVEQEDSSIKGGSGLGLAICKALVELHHGTISVTSELGRGSIFVFRLPIRQPPLSNGA
jgi:signal transduction histidine kinase